MNDMGRMFLVEKGKYVVIRDGSKQAVFESFEEFYHYCSSTIDLTGKVYIDYEPDRNIYLDSEANITIFACVPEYEAVIADIDTIISKKSDIYFGKTPEECLEITKGLMIQAVQRLLDTTARARGYDGILSASTYATSTNALFRAEGQACVVWRDNVWASCYQIMADVQNGVRAIPTIPDLLSEMPEVEWPSTK